VRGVTLRVALDAPVKARHGRLERRELLALADAELNSYIGSAGVVGEAWPHLAQVCRVERQRMIQGKRAVAVSYAISSLSAGGADAQRLLSLLRSYWGIENGLHWVRDVTMDEDRCQVRSGPPQRLSQSVVTWPWRCCGAVRPATSPQRFEPMQVVLIWQ